MSSTEGYEIHQKLRTKAVRLLKKKDFNQTISILFNGSKELLSKNEQGSGCDLACYMIQVYQQSELKVDDESRNRIIELLKLAKNDFWRKKFLDSALKWTVTAPNSPQGDWKLRLFAGEMLSKGEYIDVALLSANGSFHESEKHLLYSCLTSPIPIQPLESSENQSHPAYVLAKSTFDWLESYSKESEESKSNRNGKGESWETLVRLGSGNWAFRGVIPLVTSESLPSATLFLNHYLELLIQSQPTILLPMKPNPKPYTSNFSSSLKTPSTSNRQLFITGSTDLNFCQMVLALIEDSDSIKSSNNSNNSSSNSVGGKGNKIPEELKNQWIMTINQWRKEGGKNQIVLENLNEISELYFDLINRSRNQMGGGNFMNDMLSSLMGGGVGNQQQQKTLKNGEKEEKVKVIKQGLKPEPIVHDGDEEDVEESNGPKQNSQKVENKIQAPEEEDLD